MPGTGDLETGKAWRLVRRPSDMVCIVPSLSNHETGTEPYMLE